MHGHIGAHSLEGGLERPGGRPASSQTPHILPHVHHFHPATWWHQLWQLLLQKRHAFYTGQHRQLAVMHEVSLAQLWECAVMNSTFFTHYPSTALTVSQVGSDLAMRRVRGNLILESWNCLMLTRLVSAAGTVAVLMICRHGARTRCLEAISCTPTPSTCHCRRLLCSYSTAAASALDRTALQVC